MNSECIVARSENGSGSGWATRVKHSYSYIPWTPTNDGDAPDLNTGIRTGVWNDMRQYR
jgi:hypothetical protein